MIVTGGTGALGREIVSRFLASGDRVWVPWLIKSERDAVAELWPEALASGRVVLVEADVAEPEAARRLVESAEPVAGLVNAAGGFAGGAPVHETDPELWTRLFRMNALTAVVMCRAVLPGMLARGAGSIVNVSSRAAFVASRGLAAYSASKAAVAVLTETLQAEVEGRGLRVNAIVPETLDTPANRAAMPDADPGRWSPPERVAAVVHWLMGADASTVRGGCLPV